MNRRLPALCLVATLAACGSIPHAPAPQRTATVLTPRPEARQCMAQLGRQNASFTPLPDQYFGAGCTQLGTVKLAALRGDDSDFRVTNLGALTCPMAEAVSGWARYGVDRAARQILGSALARIETMGSYSCRTIAGSDRMSAHATAGALDVSAFVLADGRRISIKADWASQSPQTRAFLSTIHASACKRFGTVLGPAYNAAHHDHLHMELSGRAFCR